MSCADRLCGDPGCCVCHPELTPHAWRYDCTCERCDRITAQAEDAAEARAEARKEREG
jgi:hypothetical protein